MRNTFLIAALSLFNLAVNAQREVVLNFNLKNTTSKDTLTLSWGANNKSVTPIITTVAANEAGEITLPLNEPRVVVLGAKGADNSLEMLLSPGESITITGKLKNSSRYLFDRMRVRGAKHQMEYRSALDLYQTVSDSLDEQVRSDFKDVCRIIDNAKKVGNEAAIAEVYGSERGRKYIEEVISNFHERSELIEAIVYQHRENFMGPLLMIRLIGRLSKANRDMYNKLSDNAKLSYYGREVKDEVYPPTLVGDIAPTVTVQNTEGKDKMLSFTRHGNRYLLLDFWASWCEPCHKEIPNLKAIYERYHEKGLDIIGISADHNVDDWKSTLEEQNERWCNYIDKNRQAITEYKVQYIPSIFIIDAEGNIIAEKLRGKELSDFIDDLFKE